MCERPLKLCGDLWVVDYGKCMKHIKKRVSVITKSIIIVNCQNDAALSVLLAANP